MLPQSQLDGPLVRSGMNSYPTYAVRKSLADQFEGQNTVNPLIRTRNVKPTMAIQLPHGWTHEW